MNKEGLTIFDFIKFIISIVIIAFFFYAMSKYGNKPVSEMPIWLYWLFH